METDDLLLSYILIEMSVLIWQHLYIVIVYSIWVSHVDELFVRILTDLMLISWWHYVEAYPGTSYIGEGNGSGGCNDKQEKLFTWGYSIFHHDYQNQHVLDVM